MTLRPKVSTMVVARRVALTMAVLLVAAVLLGRIGGTRGPNGRHRASVG